MTVVIVCKIKIINTLAEGDNTKLIILRGISYMPGKMKGIKGPKKSTWIIISARELESERRNTRRTKW